MVERDGAQSSIMWKGQMLFPLKNIISQHRSAFIAMESAALYASISNIKSDSDPLSLTCKHHHFEGAASYRMPNCPVLRKHPSGIKQDVPEVSNATTGSVGTKASVGETSVVLSYHTREECDSLSTESPRMRMWPRIPRPRPRSRQRPIKE
eukprot:768658-Ditylum_brightwellii.AAC.3